MFFRSTVLLCRCDQILSLHTLAAQIQAQKQVEETLRKELSQQKATSAHISQQAATLRQDLMIAHAARSDADSRLAASASELEQLRTNLEESQANILQQSASASAAEADLQQQLQVLRVRSRHIHALQLPQQLSLHYRI
jgi:septal ring factor EnvC (AmiA/AmiB activator)